MSYRVDLTHDARRELQDVPAYIRAQVIQTLRRLENDPRPLRAKELRGKPGVYRLWVAGTWRVAYKIDDGDQHILVLRVRPKDKIDYESIEPPE